MKCAIIYDDIYLKHETYNHPEKKERLLAIKSALEPIKDQLKWLKPIKATKEDILRVHTKEHFEIVKRFCNSQMALDIDTLCSKGSFESAIYAAGAGIRGVDAILNKEAKRVFLAIRPPGHHATSNQSMGFCIFNNIAIAAKYAQTKGFKKIFIIDFDIHHGNGTQEIFYEDNSVFYLSTHQMPAYPGTGRSDEIGINKGRGFTKNFPLPIGTRDSELLEIYNKEVPILIDKFNPDLIMVSAGYDIHIDDPLGDFRITTNGIKELVDTILTYSNKEYIFFLEGGYNLEALGKSVFVTIEKMLN